MALMRILIYALYCWFVAAVLLAVVAWADPPVAEISGPDQSLAGDLVVLNSVATKADKKRWIIPPELANRVLKTEHQLAFSVRNSGSFVFHLVAVGVEDELIEIDTDTHVVKITGGMDGCDPPPTDPGDPGEPTPPRPPNELTKLSKQAADQLNDPTTALALAETLALISQDESIDKMRAEVSAAVEGVFLKREGVSLTKDWLNIWRRPVSDSVVVSTPAEYLAALQAIVSGLKQSAVESDRPIDEPTKTKLVFYTRDNCGWCDRWKNEVKPTIDSWNWEVIPVDSKGAVPQFDVTAPGKPVERLKGFQGVNQFERFR